MRILTVLFIAAALISGGCDGNSSTTPAVSGGPAPAAGVGAGANVVSTAPVAATAPATGPAAIAAAAGDGAVMARVNGKPIYMSDLNSILVRDFGLSVAQQLIANELVRQEAFESGVTVSDAELQAENDSVLKLAFGEVPPAAQRERMIQSIITPRNISRPEWDMIITRLATLRKLAKKQVKVTDDDLLAEFDALNGRKVTVRDIQVASLNEAEKHLKAIQAVTPGAMESKFIELAQKNSLGTTAQDGGLLPPVYSKTPGREILPAIREAALAMTKVGQVSAVISTGTAFHILYVQNIEQAKNVKFEDVKDKLVPSVTDRRIAELQTSILINLIDAATKQGKIEFVNPTLKDQDAEAKAAAKAAEMRGTK